MAFISPKGQGQTRSGRFTAPPAAGAFGGSDGAMQKLGRPFVPKPFTGSGGLSAGADTMMSMAMGRHNVQQDLGVEEMIDISALSTRKVDKRLSTKQGLKMKKYLHDLSLVDIHKTSDREIERLHEDFLGTLDSAASVVAPFIPFGDLYFAARGIKGIYDVRGVIKEFEEYLKNTFNIDVNLYDSNYEDIREIEKQLALSDDDVKAKLKQDILNIGVMSLNAIKDILMGIPGEIFGPAGYAIDLVIDLAITSTDFMDSEKIVANFLEAGKHIEDIVESLTGVDAEKYNKFMPALFDIGAIGNLLEGLASLYLIVKESESDEESYSDEEMFLESRKKKRKLQKQDEMNVAGNVAGYTGPLSGPANPKDFYKRMSKAYHGEFLNKPSKIKGKP